MTRISPGANSVSSSARPKVVFSTFGPANQTVRRRLAGALGGEKSCLHFGPNAFGGGTGPTALDSSNIIREPGWPGDSPRIPRRKGIERPRDREKQAVAAHSLGKFCGIRRSVRPKGQVLVCPTRPGRIRGPREGSGAGGWTRPGRGKSARARRMWSQPSWATPGGGLGGAHPGWGVPW